MFTLSKENVFSWYQIYSYRFRFAIRNISIFKHHTFQLPNFIENNIHKSLGILATAIKPQRKTRKHFLVISRQHRCCSIGLTISLPWSCLIFRYIFSRFCLYLIFKNITMFIHNWPYLLQYNIFRSIEVATPHDSHISALWESFFLF